MLPSDNNNPLNMLEPEPAQQPPGWPDQTKRMWRELVVTPITLEAEGITELLRRFTDIYANGGAVFACFELAYHPALHFYGSRNLWNNIDFFTKFLTLPAVREAAPMLKFPWPEVDARFWEGVHPFTFDGELAQTLARGGAYHLYPNSDRNAKQLGIRFCDALFGERYSEVAIVHSSAAWSDWFYDVAWDNTWIGVDKRLNRVWLLCLTDTD